MRVKGLIEIVFFMVELTYFLPNNIAVPVHRGHLGIAFKKRLVACACCSEQSCRKMIWVFVVVANSSRLRTENTRYGWVGKMLNRI